jgi:spermidine synthase
VFEGRSALSGRVRVVEDRRERRLLVAGDTLSVYPLNGDWSRVRPEYWWQALDAVPMPPRPTALLVGLGGGTQVHLLRRLVRPRRITVIERDAVILHAAQDWFGLREVPALEYLCGDAGPVTAWLAAARRRFDYIMEDAAYAAEPAFSETLARALVPLVAPGGVLVLNRHRRGDAGRLAALLRPRFHRVWLRRIRREAENVLLCCAGPRRYAVGRRL